MSSDPNENEAQALVRRYRYARASASATGNPAIAGHHDDAADAALASLDRQGWHALAAALRHETAVCDVRSSSPRQRTDAREAVDKLARDVDGPDRKDKQR